MQATWGHLSSDGGHCLHSSDLFNMNYNDTGFFSDTGRWNTMNFLHSLRLHESEDDLWGWWVDVQVHRKVSQSHIFKPSSQSQILTNYSSEMKTLITCSCLCNVVIFKKKKKVNIRLIASGLTEAQNSVKYQIWQHCAVKQQKALLKWGENRIMLHLLFLELFYFEHNKTLSSGPTVDTCVRWKTPRGSGGRD